MNENLVMDSELEEKINTIFQYVNELEFNRIFSTNKVFSEKDTHRIHTSDNEIKTIHNYNLRNVLDELIIYFNLVDEKNIYRPVAVDVLCSTLNDPNKYGSIHLNHSRPLAALIETIKILPENHQWNEKYELIIGLINEANESEIHGNIIRSLGYAQNIGLSVEQANEFLEIPAKADGSLAGYYVSKLTHALSTLYLTNPNPEGVVKTFKKFMGKRPYYHNQLNELSSLITFSFPTSNVSIDEYLGILTNKNMNRMTTKANLLDIKNYFIDKKDSLEFASLPYKINRSLKNGLNDLRKLYSHKVMNWQRVDEGFWAFNPTNEKWYSLGGETKILPQKVRHEFLPVNLNLLGDEFYLFHLHPNDWNYRLVTPSRYDLKNPENDIILGDLILGTPSRADYCVLNEFRENNNISLRTFIVHERGITEYSTNKKNAEHSSNEIKNLRDLTMKATETNKLILPYPADNEGFSILINDLNKRMPQSAKLKWYKSEKELLDTFN